MAEVLIIIFLAGFAIFLFTRKSRGPEPAELPPTDRQLAYIDQLLEEGDLPLPRPDGMSWR